MAMSGTSHKWVIAMATFTLGTACLTIIVDLLLKDFYPDIQVFRTTSLEAGSSWMPLLALCLITVLAGVTGFFLENYVCFSNLVFGIVGVVFFGYTVALALIVTGFLGGFIRVVISPTKKNLPK